MRFLRKIPASLLLGTALCASAARAGAIADPVDAELRALASRARDKQTWGALRRYAAAARDGEQRGLAFFVLGYWEYNLEQYRPAVADMRRAAETGFSLADFAEYYHAAAAQGAELPGDVVAVLEGFSSRHPQSVLRYDALELDAQALVETRQSRRAIQALTAEPRVARRPSLAVLLGQAYRQAQKLEDAARTFEEIYYRFPAAPEAAAAREALDQLRIQLGEAKFPMPSAEIQTARAETLFNQSRYRDALEEYDALLVASPGSSFAARWRVGRARCLLRLRPVGETLDALQAPIPNSPELDAERLSVLVEAYARREDAEAMRVVLDQLAAVYPQSSGLAAALDAAGNFFARQGDWNSAARYYQPLAESYPQTDLGREAHWRVAWTFYLQKETQKARQAFVDHLTRYPHSPHVPAALYWLGRLAERDRAAPEARALFSLIEKRFVQSYYAIEARRRLAALPADSAPEEAGTSGPWVRVTQVAQRVSRLVAPSLHPCEPPPPSEAIRPFLTLRALSLYSLAEEYLESVLSNRAAPELYFALSRIKAEQGAHSSALLTAGRVVPEFPQYDFSALPRELWELLYPRPYWAMVERQASASRLDPYLLMGLIRQESAFNPLAVSRANARGLMQILPQTAASWRSQRRAAARLLFDPQYNLRVGSRYLKRLTETYHGVLEQALAAYHAGDERVNAWLAAHSFQEPAEFLESIPIPATRIYVERVLRDAEIYRRIMTGAAAFKECGHRAERATRRLMRLRNLSRSSRVATGRRVQAAPVQAMRRKALLSSAAHLESAGRLSYDARERAVLICGF